jgi:molybdopterin synthase sulfur carrier subunit
MRNGARLGNQVVFTPSKVVGSARKRAIKSRYAGFIVCMNPAFFIFYARNIYIFEEKDCMATVLVPTPLRRLTGGQSKLDLMGGDVGSLIQAANQQYPGIAEKVLDGDGNVKRFINIFVNDSEIRTLQGLATPVGAEDKVSIVPAMAGGR